MLESDNGRPVAKIGLGRLHMQMHARPRAKTWLQQKKPAQVFYRTPSSGQRGKVHSWCKFGEANGFTLLAHRRKVGRDAQSSVEGGATSMACARRLGDHVRRSGNVDRDAARRRSLSTSEARRWH
ncbi:uncharacterized protein PSANT_02216 [Moesziomyces antarcticus]|uniref:Uncharacterized protein n=1 Tax=Pseudozyma antarctica TaxID=84753 RepID=A0A5C3FM19_PSEA2|nr:uncharacterized protein PSANT_02216 [Moesziomyces antarcticus]